MDAAFYRRFWGLQSFFRRAAAFCRGAHKHARPSAFGLWSRFEAQALHSTVGNVGAACLLKAELRPSGSSPQQSARPGQQAPNPPPPACSNPPAALQPGKWAEVSRDVRKVLEKFREEKVTVGEGRAADAGALALWLMRVRFPFGDTGAVALWPTAWGLSAHQPARTPAGPAAARCSAAWPLQGSRRAAQSSPSPAGLLLPARELARPPPRSRSGRARQLARRQQENPQGMEISMCNLNRPAQTRTQLANSCPSGTDSASSENKSQPPHSDPLSLPHHPPGSPPRRCRRRSGQQRQVPEQQPADGAAAAGRHLPPPLPAAVPHPHAGKRGRGRAGGGQHDAGLGSSSAAHTGACRPSMGAVVRAPHCWF